MQPRTDTLEAPVDPTHLTEIDITDYLDHALDDEARARIEAHLESCDACRAELVAAFRVLDRLAALGPAPSPADAPADAPTLAAAGTGEATTSPASIPPDRVVPLRRPRRWRIPAAVAAALAAGVAGLLLLREPATTPASDAGPEVGAIRAPALTGEREARLGVLAPAEGAVVAAGAPLRLRWRGGGAQAFRVTLLAEDGRPLWSAELSDSAVDVPATVALEPGVAYFWRVDALEDGRSATTGIHRLRVGP